MQKLLFLTAAVAVVLADDLPPSCSRSVFCNSPLLHHAQLARITHDSKTFVDMQLRKDEATTLAAFEVLLNETDGNPTRDQVISFVGKYMSEADELEKWTPTDYSEEPDFLARIKDENLRQFAKDINQIWLTLGRKVKATVFENPELFSLVPVTHGFIIPGGRFKELYYWDTYWIIEGLLISGMKETVKGKIENLIELLKKFGHIPNGSRWYYQERSQPPLLTAMVLLYIRATNDIEFLRKNIDALEDEMQYWLDTQLITFEKSGGAYTLLRYYAVSGGPRPESYFEDYTNAQVFESEERQKEFYIDLKSAAESGWDFSSRWFMGPDGDNSGNLTNINTKNIIPVDLNAIFANALQNIAYFQGMLHNPRRAAHWAYIAKQWRYNIEQVLWDEEDGTWYDYDLVNGKHRKFFYPSNFAPLWMGAVEKPVLKKHTEKCMSYVAQSQGLKYPGGVPSSLNLTGEQWDFPNAWPPLVSIVVNALEALDTEESKEYAFHIAQTWVRACHKGFQDNKQMFEKYDAVRPGVVGGGGEYTVQTGFGWSNGVVLEFLAKYGRSMTADNLSSRSSKQSSNDSRQSSEDSKLSSSDSKEA